MPSSQTGSIASQPFRIEVAEQTLTSIQERVATFPWHEMPDDAGWGGAISS